MMIYCHITMKFDRHLDSIVCEATVKFYKNTIIQKTNIVSSSLHETRRVIGRVNGVRW